MKTFRSALTLWLCLGAALTGHAQLSDAEKAVVLLGQHFSAETNVVYKVANRYEAKLDVYRPSHPAGPAPVLMMIHGGGWLFGSKEGSRTSAPTKTTRAGPAPSSIRGPGWRPSSTGSGSPTSRT